MNEDWKRSKTDYKNDDDWQLRRGTWNSEPRNPELRRVARRLSACDRRNDADFVARSDGGLGFFQKADIFVIQEDVNKPANMILVVADALFQTGIGPIETIDQFADRRTVGFNDLLVLG
jgi:hypothetical protein